VLAFKKKWRKMLRRESRLRGNSEKVSRKLWEFGEQVRLEIS
jgi:ribosomal protein L21E